MEVSQTGDSKMDGVGKVDDQPVAQTEGSSGFSILNPTTALGLYMKNQIMTDIRKQSEALAKNEPYVADALSIIRY
jgi:hypothetical protein